MLEQILAALTQIWTTRTGRVLTGVVLGLGLVLTGIVRLAETELQGVAQSRMEAEVLAQAEVIDAATPDPSREGRLVLIRGEARGSGAVLDPEFGVTVEGALSLTRSFEVYQWVEVERTETPLGGGQPVTSLAYVQEWRAEPVDSGRFLQPDGHRNPPAGDWPFAALRFDAEAVRLGGFEIPAEQVPRMPVSEPLTATAEQIGRAFEGEVQTVEGWQYLGGSPSDPVVGDWRMRFTVQPAQRVTLLGRQSGGRITPYTTASGSDVFVIGSGTLDLPQLLAQRAGEGEGFGWGDRLLGWLLLTAGLPVLLGMLGLLDRALTRTRRLVGGGLVRASAVMGLTLSLLVVGLCRVMGDPVGGGLCLVAGIGLLLGPSLRRERPAPQAG